MAEKTVPKSEIARRPGEDVAVTTRETGRYLVPAVDIFETDKGLTVLCDMPGVETENLDVRVANNLLTIHGSMNFERPAQPVYEEFELLDYFRQFELPDEIDGDRISAELRHGVLTLTLPRAEKAMPKQIKITVKK